MRISDWSSDVCSSDLAIILGDGVRVPYLVVKRARSGHGVPTVGFGRHLAHISGISVLIAWHLLSLLTICHESGRGQGSGKAVKNELGRRERDEPEERRVGKACDGTCRIRWRRDRDKK